MEILKCCFEFTNWTVFEEATHGLDKYTDTVTAYLGFCENSHILTTAQVKYSNNKAWFSPELRFRFRFREKEAAFRSGERILYKEAKNKLDKKIKAANKK